MRRKGLGPYDQKLSFRFGKCTQHLDEVAIHSTFHP